MTMDSSPFKVKLNRGPSDFIIIITVSELLRLGARTKTNLMVFVPVPSPKTPQVVCFVGDEEHRLTFDNPEEFTKQWPGICTRLKILSGMMISRKDITQTGKVWLPLNRGQAPILLSITAIPTKFGEVFNIVMG
jgi:hypothetical protein